MCLFNGFINFKNFLIKMNPFLKFFIRLLLIIAIFLFYLKHRNNQCIKNQNCQPYFISHILSFKKTFEIPHIIFYKIEDNLANIDIYSETYFSIEDLEKDKDVKSDLKDTMRYLMMNYKEVYNDFSIIKNNDIVIKKFSLKNTSKNPIKVLPKMVIEGEGAQNDIKIYNCFCDSKIIVEPLSTKTIFIYFASKKGKDLKKDRIMQMTLIKVSI